MQQTIDPETQKRLNTPLSLPGGFSPEDQMFLNQIISHVESGKISLYAPSSILNMPVYEKISPEQKAKADTQSFSLVAALREIYGLWKAYQTATFQLANLVSKIRIIKENFEKEMGDVFVV